MALTRDEYIECLHSNIQAAMQVMKDTGNVEEAMRIAGSTLSLAWELTRPEAEYHARDLLPQLSEAMSRRVNMLNAIVVFNDDGPICAFGHGAGNDGQLTSAESHVVNDLIEHEMSLMFDEFGLDREMMNQAAIDVRIDGPDGADMAFVGTVDQQVAEFNEELDHLFDTWSGGG